MKTIRSVDDMVSLPNGSVVTIGNFDGVHRGHQALLSRLVAEAERLALPSVVVTFDPHPQKVLHPEKRPFYMLTTLDEKKEYLNIFGVDILIIITFSREFARTKPDAFVRDHLWSYLRMKKILTGYDSAFGKNKEGDALFLRHLGKELGFSVEEIDAVTVNGHIVSSTAIRDAITAGDLSLAHRMLGRKYRFSGIVVKGHHRGTGIGIPTANIESEKVIPASGVYAVTVRVDGCVRGGVLNIGFNPTFGNTKRSVEVHLFDFHEDIYGASITVQFEACLRDEIAFSSPEELVRQIRKDMDEARKILGDLDGC